jgi:hypothetical protein
MAIEPNGETNIMLNRTQRSLHRRRNYAALFCATLSLSQPAMAQTVQPAPAGAPIARLADIWPGIVFVCVPDAKLAWSFPACEGIEKEARRLAETGQVRIAVAGGPKTPRPNEAARQAGFDGERALAVVAKFTAASKPDEGGNLTLEATSRADANPGVTQPLYRTIYTQSALLRQSAREKDAIATAETMLGGLFGMLLRPVKR